MCYPEAPIFFKYFSKQWEKYKYSSLHKSEKRYCGIKSWIVRWICRFPDVSLNVQCLSKAAPFYPGQQDVQFPLMVINAGYYKLKKKTSTNGRWWEENDNLFLLYLQTEKSGSRDQPSLRTVGKATAWPVGLLESEMWNRWFSMTVWIHTKHAFILFLFIQLEPYFQHLILNMVTSQYATKMNKLQNCIQIRNKNKTFFFFFFLQLHLWHVEVPRLGANWSCSCQPTRQPRHHWTWAASVTYALSCSNAGSH